MLNLTSISGLFARTTSSTASPRRRGKTRFTLEALEGRDLMSGLSVPPVSPPPPQPPPTVPPIHIVSTTPPSPA
jgi:hypothetical protein